jgi:hypothetical protein
LKVLFEETVGGRSNGLQRSDPAAAKVGRISMLERALPPLDIIRAVTTNAAEMLGW